MNTYIHTQIDFSAVAQECNIVSKAAAYVPKFPIHITIAIDISTRNLINQSESILF